MLSRYRMILPRAGRHVLRVNASFSLAHSLYLKGFKGLAFALNLLVSKHFFLPLRNALFTTPRNGGTFWHCRWRRWHHRRLHLCLIALNTSNSGVTSDETSRRTGSDLIASGFASHAGDKLSSNRTGVFTTSGFT